MAISSCLSKILFRRGGGTPLAFLRAIGAQRSNYHAAATTTTHSLKFPSPTTTTTFNHNYYFSSLATTKKQSVDRRLLQVIDSEIKCSQESDDQIRSERIPDRFPFKIEDNPGHQTITLKREYNGEAIKVEVHMPSLVTGDEDDDGGDDDDDTERAPHSSIPMIVSVSKESGPCLEFGVTAFPDEVAIDSMSVKESASDDQIPYEGPDFTSLDENLQKAFQKYLEIRGIRPIVTNFLYEYMINKDSREYLLWLNNLKKFIEK